MKDNFKDLFSLSSGERKGITVLVLIIIILLAVRLFLVFHKPLHHEVSNSVWFGEMKDAANLDSGEYRLSSFDSAQDDYRYTQDDFSPPQDLVHSPAEIFDFDPNTITPGDLRRLGLNNRLIKTWLNYRNKGGKFRIASDIGKIYGMSPETYTRLLPHVKIKLQSNEFSTRAVKIAEIIKRDLNLSDSADLIRIKGIGPVLSGRIVRYRSLLGGYYSTDQLLEVYGFSDSVLIQVNRWFYADSTVIRKININKASENELQKHPYLGRYLAKGIIRYRAEVLKIEDLEELKINGLLTTEQFEKIRKYLVI